MLESLDAATFVKALMSDEGLQHRTRVSGLVKKTADPKFIEFSINACQDWVKVPVEIIEKVYVLGKHACRDHSHDYITLEFKPATNPEAKVFASLLHDLQARLAEPSRRTSDRAPCYKFKSNVQTGVYMCDTQLEQGPNWTLVATFDNDPACVACNRS